MLGSVSPKGYRRIKVNGRLVMEHRYVMERHLGRALGRSEVVHHINGDRLDNRVENLEVKGSQGEHLLEHQPKAQWLCLRCGEPFASKPSARQKFCSRLCYHKAHQGVAPAGASFGEPAAVISPPPK